MSLIRLVPLLILILIVNACADEEEILTDPLFIDPAFIPYFENFAAAAASRGLIVDFQEKGIEAYLENIQENNIAGQCSATPGSRTITIDRRFWSRAGDLDREFLLFHELGHCYLDRVHLDTKHADGTCTSVMQSGTGLCRNNYSYGNRSVYLDELFSN